MATVIMNWSRVLASVRAYPDAAIRAGIIQVLRNEPSLQPLIKASGGELNVMERIFLILRESLREMNADKAYYLKKLQECNDVADGLSDYLAYLVDQSQKLAASEKGKGQNDEPYDCQPAEPRRWLAGLPVKQVVIPVLTLN